MEQATQVFVAVSLLAIGLSHLFRPNAWVAYYQSLAAQGTMGAFTEGFLCLTFGALVAAFHNVWQGPAIVVTLLGWGHVLKGLGRFMLPELGVRVMKRASPERAWFFQVGGIFALLLSGFVCWLRFRPH